MYHAMDEGVTEVRVRTMGGQICQFHVDKFANMGGVQDRVSKTLGRGFHEIRMICNGSVPDMLAKVMNYRGRLGYVDLAVVINRSCRWCNRQIEDPISASSVLDTEIGDFCGESCSRMMRQELADPCNMFVTFGVRTNLGDSARMDAWLPERRGL